MSDAPLPDEGEAAPAEKPAPPSRPAPPPFRLSTFLLTFLFVMGLWMLVDSQARMGVADLLSVVLAPAIGFGGHYLLLTMFLAAVIEMLATALAYNWATDWVKAARVQKWGQAFRKVQSEALRSGKKDRIDALKPHQQRLTILSSEVSIAQLKGMAITWFLVIAIYTWVGIFIGATNTTQLGPCGVAGGNPSGTGACVTIGGATANLLSPTPGLSFLPLWFVIFSLYTIPTSVALRRALKHWWLKRYLAAHRSDAPGPGAVGGGA